MNISSPLEFIHPRSLKHLSSHLHSLVQGRLWLKVLIGMAAGIGVGLLLGTPGIFTEYDTALRIGDWLALPGLIFLTLIQMIVVPLVFASVIRGLAASEDIAQLKQLGSRVVVYFLFTTSVAISLGIITAVVIEPGSYVEPTSVSADSTPKHTPAGTNGAESKSSGNEEDTPIPQMIVQILPENPLASMIEKEMLQVVLFSVILGLALVTMQPEKSKILLELMGSLQEVCMTVVRWAMVLAPLAVFGLMARVSIKIGLDALLGMAAYIGTVLLGLFFLLLFYIAVVATLGKKNIFHFLSSVREVQLLAFSTSSSAAVMPLSIKTAEEKLDIRPSVSQFLIPFGATINMDGTALYQGVATVFLAQVYGVDLSLASLLLVVVTAVGASIGTPATPGVGIVILSTVLSSVGVPASGIALIIGVDRILDMSRTTLNVTGDLVACCVMDNLVAGGKDHIRDREDEMVRELKRAETGEDVLIGDEA